jgi:putative toxin-antitoxin system antitoxin component (TIGR02293 family)
MANTIALKRRSDKWTKSGGPGNILGVATKDIQQMIDRLQAGFSFNTLERFQKASGLPLATIAELLQIPPRTFARRKSSGRLDPQESERLLRIATLFEKAITLFEGDVAGARAWFSRPNRALGNDSPLSFARSELGAREVEDLIHRLEYGIFS